MTKKIAPFIFAILTTFTAHAQNRSVAVSGQCTRAVIPDRGGLTVTPDNVDMKVQNAVKRTTEAYETLKRAVQALNLKNAEIGTSEYTVQEVREWTNNKSVFKGFRVRMGLDVQTSDYARLGEVIALAANQKMTDVGMLRTFLSEEKSRVEREECLGNAIKNARAKAEKMASAAGAKLGKIIQLRDGEAAAPPLPVMMERKAFAADAAVAAPGIDAANQKISVSVDAVYALE